jgi:hypothetical protein
MGAISTEKNVRRSEKRSVVLAQPKQKTRRKQGIILAVRDFREAQSLIA